MRLKWIVVVILLFLIPVIGLPVLLAILYSDKSSRREKLTAGKIARYFSYWLLLTSPLSLIMGISMGSGFSIVMAILYFICGIVILRIGRRFDEKGERYKQYIDLVVNQGITSVDDIASVTGVDYKDVMTDLQKMIDEGFFPQARLDNTQRAIVFRRDEVQKAMAEEPQSTYVHPRYGAQQEPQEKVVTCPCCGANNKVMSGKVSECQYCGSFIQ